MFTLEADRQMSSWIQHLLVTSCITWSMYLVSLNFSFSLKVEMTIVSKGYHGLELCVITPVIDSAHQRLIGGAHDTENIIIFWALGWTILKRTFLSIPLTFEKFVTSPLTKNRSQNLELLDLCFIEYRGAWE